MPKPKHFLVFPAPQRLVSDRQANERGLYRFVGRALDRPHGILGEPVKVQPSNEYLRSLRQGDLLAADEATASFAGVPLCKSCPVEEPLPLQSKQPTFNVKG